MKLVRPVHSGLEQAKTCIRSALSALSVHPQRGQCSGSDPANAKGVRQAPQKIVGGGVSGLAAARVVTRRAQE